MVKRRSARRKLCEQHLGGRGLANGVAKAAAIKKKKRVRGAFGEEGQGKKKRNALLGAILLQREAIAHRPVASAHVLIAIHPDIRAHKVVVGGGVPQVL